MPFLDESGVTTLSEELRARLSNNSRVFTGTSTDAASATTHAVTLDDADGFVLKPGVMLLVTFTNGVSDLRYINVGGIGSHGVTSALSKRCLYPYETAVLSYTGTYWKMNPTIDMVSSAASQATGIMWQWGTCATKDETHDKVVSDMPWAAPRAGAIISVKFTYANTYVGRVRMEVMSINARPIYVNGAITSATNTLLWSAGEMLTFYYDGSYWNFLYRGITPPFAQSS